jgi:putative membrane protein
MDRIVQLLINAGALYVAVLLVSGLDFAFEPEMAWLKFLLVAFIFGLVNTFVRPVLRILTLPITLMTLGIFLIIINALMLLLTGAISAELDLGLTVADFIAALLGAIVISVVGFVLSLVIGTTRRVL